MKAFLKDIFEYNHHFNQKLGDIFNENSDKISEKAINLFSHILNAHQVWNNRIEPKQATFGIWEVHPIQSFKNIDKMNYEHTQLILNKSDLNKTIDYTTRTGQAFNKKIKDLLFHTINHSTYHRGQIATEMRQCGIEPLATDYIRYKR